MSAGAGSRRRARPLARRLRARLPRFPVSAGIADPAVFVQRFDPGGVSAEGLHARMVPHPVGQFGAVRRARHQPDDRRDRGVWRHAVRHHHRLHGPVRPLAACSDDQRDGAPADPHSRRHRRHLAADPGQSRRLRPVAHGDRARPHIGRAADHRGDHDAAASPPSRRPFPRQRSISVRATGRRSAG